MRVGYPGEMSRSQLDYKTEAGHGDTDLGVSCRDELSSIRKTFLKINELSRKKSPYLRVQNRKILQRRESGLGSEKGVHKS